MARTRISNNKAGLRQLAMSCGWGKFDRHPTLSGVIDTVRRRWRLRLLLTGFCSILLIGTAVIFASAWLINYWHFDSRAVWLLRIVIYTGAAALLYWFFLRPLRREVSDASVALYLEEHEPELGSIILSAVDARSTTSKDVSPDLVDKLVDQSLDACQRVDYGRRVERQRLKRAAFKPGLVLVFILGMIAFPLDFLRNGVPLLLNPWAAPGDYSPYRLLLQPGDIEIARGDDQLITARVVGFDPDSTVLYTSDDGGASWRETAMTPGSGTGHFETYIFDLNTNLDYYIKAGSLQSERYRVAVADIPAIAEISLHYRYPAYTMKAPQTTRGSGDITALRGTRVEVRIEPTIAIPGGELLLDDGEIIDLVKQDENVWVAAIDVEQDSGYRVALQRASGKSDVDSRQFRISALDDRFPSVSIRSPGRDVKVSAIEEAIMQVRAQDDQGIAGLEIVLSVNGEDERKIDLLAQRDGVAQNDEIDAEHTLFLEDLQLRPGDLISYYVQARDLARRDDARTATSDIFFYQIRPFRLDYFQSDQGQGGGGGQQGGQQEGFLTEQQKQFVVATFKMIRDREKYSDEAYFDNLQLLSRAQARIRDRVEAIVRRIGNRAMLKMDKSFEVVAEELPLAARAMAEVEKNLQETEIDAALTDAQVALKHLQRADAAFRRLNLTLARGGSGANANNANVEDLANLFKLEMDKLKHQYETIQHGRQKSTSEVIDETLERLRELAQRHQQQLEQMMRRQDQAVGNDPSAKQLALAEELEAMARQLEKLSRNNRNEELQQSIRQMKNAAESLRRATSTASSGASTASGGVGQARQIAENLREAQRLLDQSQVRQFSNRVEQTLKLAERLENNQAGIKQRISRMDETDSEAFETQLNRVEEQKRTLVEDLDELQRNLGGLVTSAREEQPQAARSLKQAIKTAREYRLNDRIQRSRDMLLLSEKNHAIDNENEIEKGIKSVRAQIETALANVTEQHGRGLELSLDKMRALARELRLVRGQAGGASADRQLSEIAGQAGELSRRLQSQGVVAGDIEPVLAKIEQLSQLRQDRRIADFDQALRALMDLEYALRNRLNASDLPELVISESAELPEGYEEMIADYYRKLSRSTRVD